MPELEVMDYGYASIFLLSLNASRIFVSAFQLVFAAVMNWDLRFFAAMGM